MKKPLWLRSLALILAIALCGCNPRTESPDPSETTAATVAPTIPAHKHAYVAGKVVAATCTSEGYTVYTCGCGDTRNEDYTEKAPHIYEETVIPATTESDGYTLYLCTVCSYAYKDNYTDKLVEDMLTEEQKNSIAMLNYLAMLTQEIDSSKNNRLFLEEAYASLINNTNPEKVNKITEEHLCNLLDTIDSYRFISAKRDHLQYYYNQEKAVALRSAFNLQLLADSSDDSILESVDNYYKYIDELNLTYLMDGWTLDNAESVKLHESKKNAFLYMIDIVREEGLPGELALNETAIENFVTWTNNDNVYQQLHFLESEVDTYRSFGSYWLALAACYYEIGDHQKCLDSISAYQDCQADIFRKDYYLAQIMPKAIVAAGEVYSEQYYITHAENYLNTLKENTELNEWDLRYFAAQAYLDLYLKTNNIIYLEESYQLVLDNVNYLVNEQKKLTSAYLAEIPEITVPQDATKDESSRIKEYNKALKNNRKTELPAVYEPLLLNCELLFTLMDKVDVSPAEKEKIDAILGVSGYDVFLNIPLINRYASTTRNMDVEATFSKSTLTLPVYCVSANSVIRVSVTEAGNTTVYEDWKVTSVERSKDGFEAFTATYTSKNAEKQQWSENSTVKVEIFDEAGSEYAPLVLNFKVSSYTKIVLEFISFEQVK